MKKSIEKIYEEYDKAKVDCRVYAAKDEELQNQIDELIIENALPPNYGLDNPLFRARLQGLRSEVRANFKKYQKAREMYEKAADELVEAVTVE